MGKWQPFSNLRTYLEYHPPAVVFVFCMLMLAMTFVGFGFYTQTHRVKNPDATPDWNQFLNSIANLRFCLPENGSVEHELTFGSRKTGNGPSENSMGEIYRGSLLVPFAVKGNTGVTPSILSTALLGSQVGFKGAAGRDILNMSLILYPLKTTKLPKPNSPGTFPEEPFTCIQLNAPMTLLPQTPSPPECPIKQRLGSDSYNVKALAQETQSDGGRPSLHCLKVDFTPDDRFTAFLSKEEKTLIGQRLLLASASLLVTCSLLCFSASLTCCRSRRYHGNDLGLQKEPLLES